ncbi:hypothetical protein [Phreatobacter stygius]|uniref:Uncharacterized protein n=1 Tax=Phreatobacter stygius TaxID=1940610 RepID=A0A4D7AV42_9HYPH|nr:hypothetical protein [Phreatobacter stygius]QCI65614.1 hypothetical protein E8M01_16220 [Phreatobacter stygius]
MSKTSFTIAFDGPALKEGRMDVRQLAPALLAFGRVVETANRALNGPDNPVKVEAVATKIGSFEVLIDVVLPYWEQLRGLLISQDVDGALKLVQALGLVGSAGGGLIFLLRRLKGRPITSASRTSDGNVTIRFPGDDGGETSLVVPAEVLRVYQEFAVQRELKVLLDTLASEDVDTITFIPRDKKKDEEAPAPVQLTKADRAIVQPIEPPSETVVETTQRMALSIRSLAFTEGNKWRLFDGQNVITATIDDKGFLDQVDRSLARFAKGDVLICQVRTVQKQTPEGLKTEHTVLQVIEHRPAPTQMAIAFDPPSSDEKNG